MDSIVILPIILAILEFYETSVFNGNTGLEILTNIYQVYRKGLINFLVIHLNFYFLIYVLIYYQIYSFSMFFLILLKTLDILFKLYLMIKIDNDDINDFIVNFAEIRVGFISKYFELFFYPISLYFILTWQ